MGRSAAMATGPAGTDRAAPRPRPSGRSPTGGVEKHWGRGRRLRAGPFLHLSSLRLVARPRTLRLEFLKWARLGSSSWSVYRRVTCVLIALVVALATTVPLGAWAMPMPPASGVMTVGQPCQNCPQPDQTGNIIPDKMPPACQTLACSGVLATLLTPALVPERVQFKVAYAPVPSARWAEAAPAPDPFPPRPIVLL
jgi:hypothetical protein